MTAVVRFLVALAVLVPALSGARGVDKEALSYQEALQRAENNRPMSAENILRILPSSSSRDFSCAQLSEMFDTLRAHENRVFITMRDDLEESRLGLNAIREFYSFKGCK